MSSLPLDQNWSTDIEKAEITPPASVAERINAASCARAGVPSVQVRMGTGKSQLVRGCTDCGGMVLQERRPEVLDVHVSRITGIWLVDPGQACKITEGPRALAVCVHGVQHHSVSSHAARVNSSAAGISKGKAWCTPSVSFSSNVPLVRCTDKF